ncbi:MAG TPA: hypothetical protein VII39_12025 [Bradyrhizobium sp.]
MSRIVRELEGTRMLLDFVVRAAGEIRERKCGERIGLFRQARRWALPLPQVFPDTRLNEAIDHMAEHVARFLGNGFGGRLANRGRRNFLKGKGRHDVSLQH